MKAIRTKFNVLWMLALPLAAAAQSSSTSYVDNALRYNRLLMEKTGEGVYKLVGPYKVIGTSFLFGEKAKGNLFAPETKAYNIYLSYNTYNQQVEFYSTANPNQALVREPGTVDSFFINPDAEMGITEPIKFVYGASLGTTAKAYFKVIYEGRRFSVYKQYRSDVGYVSSNYVQSELRQFDLLYDYYYTDKEKNEKVPRKLKSNAASIAKEFKDVKDISPVLTGEAFAADQEEALKKAFHYLNN